jgi:phosphotransferase system  glucose/maltose/N-acetylglucosamine-specific IIC component
MYLVAIAWLYVAVMMTVAEATHPSGTILGAFFTFLMYGLLPIALALYILNTPNRKKARKLAEAQLEAAAQDAQPVSDPSPNTRSNDEQRT